MMATPSLSRSNRRAGVNTITVKRYHVGFLFGIVTLFYTKGEKYPKSSRKTLKDRWSQPQYSRFLQCNYILVAQENSMSYIHSYNVITLHNCLITYSLAMHLDDLRFYLNPQKVDFLSLFHQSSNVYKPSGKFCPFASQFLLIHRNCWAWLPLLPKKGRKH